VALAQAVVRLEQVNEALALLEPADEEDVERSIAKLLDRYTLKDIVEITLRKLRRDKVTPAFIPSSIGLQSLLPTKGSPVFRGRRKLNSVEPISVRQRNKNAEELTEEN